MFYAVLGPIALCFVIACATASRSGDRPTLLREGDIRTLILGEKPLMIHSKEDGWAETPSLAVTSEFTYVAYDVREGYESHVYLSRIPRGAGEGSIEKIRVDNRQGEIEFWPCTCLDSRGGIWVAWTSLRDGEWSIKACRIQDMEIVEEGFVSLSTDFVSQVKVAARDGVRWFVWVEWLEGEYRIVASRHTEGRWIADKGFKVYEGQDPVARPDLHLISGERAIIVWDQYARGRHSIHMREIDGYEMRAARELSGEDYAHSWEPHVTGHGEDVLVTWHMVPGGSERCQPAAAMPGKTMIEAGIDRPEDSETWRVGCFTDDIGNTWIVWTTRIMYRNTRLYIRRIGQDGLSKTCKVDFNMRRNFINWFDCRFDSGLAFVWEFSGGVYLSEFALPSLGDIGLPEPAGSAEEPEPVTVPARPERSRYSAEYEGEHLHVYFGDHHSHTSFSDGRAYPDISMLLARDVRGLDYMCITDHDITLTPGEFAWNNAVADELTENGTYVCMHGYEPSKGWAANDFGHWNMLYPGGGDVFQFEDGMTPRALQAYAIDHDAVLIPHHVGASFAPYNWDYFDAEAEPVVEMCSIHGIFESLEGNEGRSDMVEGKFLQDGLARGYRFGFVGASDFHNCFEALNREAGLTGVYVDTLTADAIFDAYRKRRTFALTGGRIVVDFRCNGKFMGEVITDPEDLSFNGYAASPDAIAEVKIISNGTSISDDVIGPLTGGHEANRPEVAFELPVKVPDTPACYYLRVRTAKGDYAWSSPIWVVPAR